MASSAAQIVYVTLDLRRGLWVSQATDALIVCAYQSDLLPQLRKQGVQVWCFEEAFPEAEIPQSTFLLLSRALTLHMLRSLNKPLEFIVFKPSNKIRRWVEDQGWSLLSSDVNVCRQLEDKITFAEFADKYDIPVPEHKTVLWNPDDREVYHQEFGDTMIVQGRMGHAGSCTYALKKNDAMPALTDGSRVKISRFVSGNTYTLNASVKAGDVFFGPIWRQVMNVPEWNTFDFGTVGVSPAPELNHEQLQNLQVALQSLTPLFKKLEYQGFLGIDLMLDQAGTWWVIECNPRLTATISLQCLEDLQAERPALLHPRLLSSPGNWQASFGQLIFRNPLQRSWKTPKTLQSGIYTKDERGQWFLKSRSVDARELNNAELLLILSRLPGTAIEPGADYASLQFSGSAYTNGALDDRFLDFYERIVMGFRIRPKDFWKDRFGRIASAKHHPLFLLRKPVLDPREKNKELSKKILQTEVEVGEVVRLLGEQEQAWLVEKVDGTRGWLPKSATLNNAENTDFFRATSKALSSEAFWEHWKGTPYQLGGVSTTGIDCSAFVQRYFWDVLGQQIPKYSQDQRAACQHFVELNDLSNHDLVFMHSKDHHFDHVGIYVDGLIWHSSLETGVVKQSLKEVQKQYEIEVCKRIDMIQG